MSKINGQITICDRCGAQTVRKCTAEGEADGGWTRWNNFEALPDGWDLVAVPKCIGWVGNGNAYHGYLQVCPSCHELWDKVVIDGFLKGTKYYKRAEDEK